MSEVRITDEMVEKACKAFVQTWDNDRKDGWKTIRSDMRNAIAAIASPIGAFGWREIDSAPKDTWFIALQDQDFYPCEWHSCEPDEGRQHEGWLDLFNQSFEAPTHWFPVPPMAALSGMAEPVAWRWKWAGAATWHISQSEPDYAENRIVEPLYSAPSPDLAAENKLLHDLNADAHAIVDRIWDILGRPSYEELAGRTIYDLVSGLVSRAAAPPASEREEIERLRKALTDAREYLEGEPTYHHEGMGCGLEDRGIRDRYQAMQHGWDSAMERAYGEHVTPAIEIIDSVLNAEGK